MAALLITYDLNAPGQNYTGLHEEIKVLGTAWWHYLESTWIVQTTLTPREAAQRLKAKMDDSDNLLVLDITGDTHGGWLEKDAWEWINKNV